MDRQLKECWKLLREILITVPKEQAKKGVGSIDINYRVILCADHDKEQKRLTFPFWTLGSQIYAAQVRDHAVAGGGFPVHVDYPRITSCFSVLEISP